MGGWLVERCVGERERGGDDDEVTHFIQLNVGGERGESGESGTQSVEVRRVVTDPHYL